MAPTTEELLGFKKGTKLLIVKCDEYGECYSANKAVIEAMEKGLGGRSYMVGASVQMPSPWAYHAIRYALSHPKADVGVHFTIEWWYKTMKTRPLLSEAEVPTLYGPEGYFWETGSEVWEHSNEQEIYKECRAQLEAALRLGLDVTNIDGHGGFQSGNRTCYCHVLGRLAREFRLPFRLHSRQRYEEAGVAAVRDEVLASGVISTDDETNLGCMRPNESWKEFYLRRLSELRPGLTELYIHPAVDSEELRAMCPEQGRWDKAQDRVDQYELLVHDQDFENAVKETGAHLLTWRDVREVQRNLG